MAVQEVFSGTFEFDTKVLAKMTHAVSVERREEILPRFSSDVY